jgi:hypothetical protein
MTKKVRKKATPKEPKKPDYVAGLYKIEYTLPYGLVGMLASASGKTKQEVWVMISELCNVCASRLSKKANQFSSWTDENFPGTKTVLEIEMERDRGSYDWRTQVHKVADPNMLYCTIKLGFAAEEKFTQEQVNTYITEKILLGVEDE